MAWALPLSPHRWWAHLWAARLQVALLHRVRSSPGTRRPPLLKVSCVVGTHAAGMAGARRGPAAMVHQRLGRGVVPPRYTTVPSSGELHGPRAATPCFLVTLWDRRGSVELCMLRGSTSSLGQATDQPRLLPIPQPRTCCQGQGARLPGPLPLPQSTARYTPSPYRPTPWRSPSSEQRCGTVHVFCA